MRSPPPLSCLCVRLSMPGTVAAAQPQEREVPTVKVVSEPESFALPASRSIRDGDQEQCNELTGQASSDHHARSWWPWWTHGPGNQPQIYPIATSVSGEVSDSQRASSDQIRDGPIQPNTSHPEPECTGDVNTRSEDNDNKAFGIPDKDTSLVSDDSNTPQGSSWYSPWTWYQTSSSVGAPSDANGNASTDVAPQTSVGQQTAPTNDEVPYVSNAAHTNNPATEPINPIQTSITDNRAGWISFFSSRAMAMKSITYEKEGGEMEVMDIDEDVNAAQGVGPASSANVTLPQDSSAREATQSRQLAQPSQQILAANQGLPSPGAKKTDEKQGTKIAAITSETVVRDAVFRQPSPTPSKKSVVKTTPPAPNVVLPTWNDVFHAPPRSIVPVTPPSALSKAFDLVTGAFFSREESPIDKGKGRAKAREGPCTPHEKALPRAWSILEGDGHDILRGCRRVVVIGVHGWFPGMQLSNSSQST